MSSSFDKIIQSNDIDIGKAKVLRIRSILPKIILPQNKIQLLLDWYNTDLRFQDNIPQSFKEGYLIINNDILNLNNEAIREYSRESAKVLHRTYRECENSLYRLIENTKQLIIYFKFNESNQLYAEGYTKDLLQVMQCNAYFGKSESDKIDDYHITTIDEMTSTKLDIIIMVLLASVLWYLATTKKLTQYYYEEKKPIGKKYKDKDIRQVPDKKIITTPIYDLTKIRKVKVEKLVQRRKGWTYSHAFRVHGFYRHYKNGKVIFVDSFIKGKNKQFKQQDIILDIKDVNIQ